MKVELIGGPRCGDDALVADDAGAGTEIEIRYEDETYTQMTSMSSFMDSLKEPPATKSARYRITRMVKGVYQAYWLGD